MVQLAFDFVFPFIIVTFDRLTHCVSKAKDHFSPRQDCGHFVGVELHENSDDGHPRGRVSGTIKSTEKVKKRKKIK